MVFKEDGRISLRSSPSMRQYKHMVARPEAEKKFSQVMADFARK
jgi:hypothetical protein